MLNYSYTFLLILLLYQCKPMDLGTEPQMIKFGETFTLKKNVPVKIAGNGKPLVLQLENVADSRCPANAICVWLGNAAISLSASNTAETVADIKMCIGDCRPEPVRTKHTMQVQVGNSMYNFTLKEVLPYPGTEKEGEEKTVRMMVEVL